MKRMDKWRLVLQSGLLVSAVLVSCAQRGTAAGEADDAAAGDPAAAEPAIVAMDYTHRNFYEAPVDKNNCFIVISKVHPEHLSVYEARGRDTVLLCTYPACLARNRGQKQVRGDNKTPESYPGKPFPITQIQDASGWHHDFGDGRGSILSYGHWFLRLGTEGFSGIGIHGSTNNRESIAVGRGSEGCIRLYDEDIEHLHDVYALVGTNVTILPEDMGPLPFEARAVQARLGGAPVAVETKVSAVVPAETVVPAEADTHPRSVTVKGSRQRFRTGPSPEKDPIYVDEHGEAICANDGDVLECIGESGQYYKVVFKGVELYINKVSCSVD